MNMRYTNKVFLVQPRVVRSLQDSIIVTFRFQDGDGNIGVLSDTEPANVQLIDSRVNTGELTPTQGTNLIRLPNLTPNTKNPSIQGEIRVKLDFTILTGFNVDSQEVRYQI